MRNIKVLVLAACVALLAAGAAQAAYTITGTGTGTGGEAISASAAFDLVTHNFGAGDVSAIRITLANTSATTSYRGNLLTGVFFSLDGVTSPLPTTAAGFDGLAATVRTSNTASISNVDIAPAVKNTVTDGTYQLSNGPFATANSGISYSAYRYGIGTVGYGLTGFNGAATSGDNYGIAAAGSNLTLDGLPTALPVIDYSAIFWVVPPTGTTSLPAVTNLAFAFGSLPDNRVAGVVPIPGTLMLLGSGLTGLVGIARFRRKRSAN